MNERNLMWVAVYVVTVALVLVGVTVLARTVTVTVTLPALTVVGLVAWGVVSTFLAFVPRKSKSTKGAAS